jgi:hypothetical protein
MTTTEYIKEMEQRLERLIKGEHVFIAVSDVHTQMGERIFNDGKDANNNDIGEYDTKNEIRVSVAKNDLPKKVKGRGFREGQVTAKKVDGSDYKTHYFSSYSALRQEQGVAINKVNLTLTGLLESNFYAGLKKLSNTEYVASLNNDLEIKKARGNEERFKKVIFQHTKKEEAQLIEKIQFESLRIMRGQ